MKFGLPLAVLGLLIGVGLAQAQPVVDYYPPQDQTKDQAKPPAPAKAAKPHAAKPYTAKPAPRSVAAIPLPSAKPMFSPMPAADQKPAPAPENPRNTSRDSGALANVPPAERPAVLAALLWSGDDKPQSDDTVRDAIRAYQKRNKGPVTGVLTNVEREALLEAARRHEDRFGWQVVVDPVTGIRIGLPTKLVPETQEAANGTRWSARHGDVQVETFRIKTKDSLGSLFEREKREPATRRVEHSVLRNDGFFVSGMQGLKRFSVRAVARNGEVRGFTLLYDQMMEGIVAPVMVAMASAFAPFPDQTISLAQLNRNVDYGTGLIVSRDGAIVTDRKNTESCNVILASGLGHAERVADDSDSGLALLRVYGKHDLTPVRLAAAMPASASLTVVGIPDPRLQDGKHAPAEMKAQLAAGNAIVLGHSLPVAGYSGAAAMSERGEVLGMMQTRSIAVASRGAAAAPVRLVPAPLIRDFLAAHHVDLSHRALPQSDMAAGDASGSIVRVICVHK